MAYAKRLKEAGCKVESYTEPGLIHGFFTNMAVFPEQIKLTISKMARFISNIR
jgi:acetyl esterase